MALSLSLDVSDSTFHSEFQRGCVMTNTIIPEWFHGVVSRKAAEEKLMCKPHGYFLIRVSESRVGFTLSYRAEDRCRHYMIDVLPGNQYQIVGDDVVHCSLHDLVAFHRTNPIIPYGDILSVACEQVVENDYGELHFAQSGKVNPSLSLNASKQERFASHRSVSEPDPKPNHRLYPNLETEPSNSDPQDTKNPTMPVARPRTMFLRSQAEDTPPQLPPRSCLPKCSQSTLVERVQQTDRHDTEGNQHKNQHQPKFLALNVAQLKKRLKKRHECPEDHTYEEINDNPAWEDSPVLASERDSMVLQQTVGSNAEELSEEHQTSDHSPSFAEREFPLEYLHPPPFAPGY